MKLNLPTWLSVVLWLGIFGTYALLMLTNTLDGLFPLFIYPVCLAVSWIMCGVSYGVLPSVKTYRENLKQQQNTRIVEAGAETARELAFDYWKWYLCCIILPIIVTIGYHLQWAGYW